MPRFSSSSGDGEWERKTARSSKGSGRGVGDWIGSSKKAQQRHPRHILLDSNHATNFEPAALVGRISKEILPPVRALWRAGWRCVWVQKIIFQRHPGLTNLSRKRAKLRRSAFGLNDRILQSKNAFSPSAALRAAACKARVALGQVRQEKRGKTKAPRQCLEALFWLLLLDLNQRHPD